jgi:hypothetical protein
VRLQPSDRDLLAAVAACPVRAVLDPLQRRVDLAEHGLGVLTERVVDLAAERDRCRLAEVVGVEAAGDLFRLVLNRAWMPVAQACNGALDPPALVKEKLTEVRGVDRAQRLSFLSRVSDAAARRRSVSPGPMPVNSTVFSRAP